jgi:hypothetical protein
MFCQAGRRAFVLDRSARGVVILALTEKEDISMSKAKSWIIVALCCVAGLLSLTSCTKNKYALRLDCAEAGYYPVDVAIWDSYKDPDGTVIWYATVADATGELKATYVDPSSSLPAYPASHAVQIQSYTVTWKGTPKLPKTSGALNLLVPLDISGGTEVTVPILVMPAISKDTVTALTDLRGDPEGDLNTFVGQLTAKATIELRGRDIVDDHEVIATIDLTGVFADYVNPNKAH